MSEYIAEDTDEGIIEKEDIIRCKDCRYFDGYCWCHLFCYGIQNTDYCSKAERKEE